MQNFTERETIANHFDERTSYPSSNDKLEYKHDVDEDSPSNDSRLLDSLYNTQAYKQS